MTLKSKFTNLLKSRYHITGTQAPNMSRETALILEIVETELKQIRLELEIALQNKAAAESVI